MFFVVVQPLLFCQCQYMLMESRKMRCESSKVKPETEQGRRERGVANMFWSRSQNCKWGQNDLPLYCFRQPHTCFKSISTQVHQRHCVYTYTYGWGKWEVKLRLDWCSLEVNLKGKLTARKILRGARSFCSGGDLVIHPEWTTLVDSCMALSRLLILPPILRKHIGMSFSNWLTLSYRVHFPQFGQTGSLILPLVR